MTSITARLRINRTVTTQDVATNFLETILQGDLIKDQKEAELGSREWAFTDPQRVATEALAGLLKLDPSSITEIRQTRKAQGRFVYEWKPVQRKTTYMVVVSRPYFLSFYAPDAKKIVWVVTAAYESTCGE